MIAWVHTLAAILKPKNAGHYSSWVIDAKEKAVVLTDLENYGASDRDFCQQEVISQYKEHFALILKELTQILMKDSLIFPILNLFIASLLLLNDGLVVELLLLIIGLIVISLIVLIPAVSEREHIIPDLEDKYGEVQVAHIEVNML